MKFIQLAFWIAIIGLLSVQAKDKKRGNSTLPVKTSFFKNGEMLCDTTIITLISSIEMISNSHGPFN